MTEKEILEKLRKEIDSRSPDDFESIERKIKYKRNFFPIVFKISATAAAILLPVITVNLTNSMNPLNQSKTPIAEITTSYSSSETTVVHESVTVSQTTLPSQIPDHSDIITTLPTETTFTQESHSDVELTGYTDISVSDIQTPATSESTQIITSVTADKTTTEPLITTTLEENTVSTIPKNTTSSTTKKTTTLTTTTKNTTSNTTKKTTSSTTPQNTITTPKTCVTTQHITDTSKPDTVISPADSSLSDDPTITINTGTSKDTVTTVYTTIQDTAITITTPAVTVPCSSTTTKPSAGGNNNVLCPPPPEILSFSIEYVTEQNPPVSDDNGLDIFSFSSGKYVFTVYYVSKYRVIVEYENETKIYSVPEVVQSGIITINKLYENGLPAMLTPVVYE